MADQPSAPANDRFKAEMPQIPGVTGVPPDKRGPGNGLWIVVGGLVAVLVAVIVAARLMSKPRKSETLSAPPTAQIEVPATVAPADLPMPMATESSPVVAQVGDLAKPWDYQEFVFKNSATGERVPALLVRLPGAGAGQSGGYWALAMKAAYGTCQLEFVQDLGRLKNDYGYGRATHAMVGNPCSRTVYDPLKYASIPGGALARGAIVQGTDLRPPLGIEVRVKGKDILAVRME